MFCPKFQYEAGSDIGLKRKKNEDLWKKSSFSPLFALADGMGGHKAGEIAAKEAIENLFFSFSNLTDSPNKYSFKQILTNLLISIKSANIHVHNLSKQDLKFHGMGTTLCCCYFYMRLFIYAHVGDSRIYRFRSNNLLQLTEDHSLINKLLAKGKLLKKPSSYKNIITKAIGIGPIISPSISYTDVKKDDIFFMCSDGLSDYTPYEKIKEILKNSKNLKNTVNNLIESAKQNSSFDNITVVMIKIME